MRVTVALDVTVHRASWMGVWQDSPHESLAVAVRTVIEREGFRLADPPDRCLLVAEREVSNPHGEFSTVRTVWQLEVDGVRWWERFGTHVADALPDYLAQVAASAPDVRDARGSVVVVRDAGA